MLSIVGYTKISLVTHSIPSQAHALTNQFTNPGNPPKLNPPMPSYTQWPTPYSLVHSLAQCLSQSLLLRGSRHFRSLLIRAIRLSRFHCCTGPHCYPTYLRNLSLKVTRHFAGGLNQAIEAEKSDTFPSRLFNHRVPLIHILSAASIYYLEIENPSTVRFDDHNTRLSTDLT